ncbi:phage tail protein [Budviciaceae bacterium CWB-B4]|uniref:Phage tail protein n=1 Tax=Limnobaculum xujianqingii TaxID=2738837 RepID=A0A9D7FS57_9GAMM|nr:phage tail protein [Limnobaculum xujianqingii]MBK5072584.1 phage tail protein [Limnobaculum xujianqingii]MBK5175893.1 phage tail protein [Limnobaculum xujianqingii]
MADFYTILTDYGQQALADVLISGKQVVISHLGAGDGGGSSYEPTEDQTQLRNEIWRGDLNDLRSDEDETGNIVAEAVIPVEAAPAGGWYIREVGLYDQSGGLFAVGKYPLTFQPDLSLGSGKQIYIKIVVEVGNVDAVQLIIDHSLVLADKQYVEDLVNNKAAELEGLIGEKVTEIYDTYSATDGSQKVGFDSSTVYDELKSLARAYPFINQSKILIAAHRGMMYPYFETAQISYAICDADILEVDVQVTSDGVPVCYHDDDLSTKTTLTGAVSDFTFSQIREAKFLRLIGTKYENLVKIPTFEEFCREAMRRGKAISPEFKRYRTTADIKLMVDVVKKYHLEERCVWASFIFGDLRELRKYDKLSGAALQVDSYSAIYDEWFPELAYVLGRGYISGSLKFWNNENARIPTFKEMGLGLIVWTVDSAVDKLKVQQYGVNIIITNNALSGVN